MRSFPRQPCCIALCLCVARATAAALPAATSVSYYFSVAAAPTITPAAVLQYKDRRIRERQDVPANYCGTNDEWTATCPEDTKCTMAEVGGGAYMYCSIAGYATQRVNTTVYGAFSASGRSCGSSGVLCCNDLYPYASTDLFITGGLTATALACAEIAPATSTYSPYPCAVGQGAGTQMPAGPASSREPSSVASSSGSNAASSGPASTASGTPSDGIRLQKKSNKIALGVGIAAAVLTFIGLCVSIWICCFN